MSEPYYATPPDTGQPAEHYRHHRLVAMRVLSEIKHRRWGDPAVAVAIAQVHATLAQAAAFRELVTRRNGGGS
jgi:hypothetical protein